MYDNKKLYAIGSGNFKGYYPDLDSPHRLMDMNMPGPSLEKRVELYKKALNGFEGVSKEMQQFLLKSKEVRLISFNAIENLARVLDESKSATHLWPKILEMRIAINMLRNAQLAKQQSQNKP